MIKILFEFILLFIFCYLFYLFFVILKVKGRKKFTIKNQKIEETYLISKYKVDLEKFNKKEYKKFLNIIAVTNSFIFALTFELVQLINGIFLKVLISCVFLIPLIFISYDFIGKYYKKKGMTKNV